MRHRVFAIVAALALTLLIPAASLAGNPAPGRAATYHGVFTAAMLYGCPTGLEDPATVDVGLRAWGAWQVTINGNLAVVGVSVFGDFGSGPIHVDGFGGVKHGVWQVLTPGAGETFHLQIPSDVFLTQEDFVLTGQQLEFRLTPYFDCAYASTYGVLR